MLWKPIGARIAHPHEQTLSDIGEVVNTAIQNIPTIYSNVRVDKYVIMPNHLHMIIKLYSHGDDGGRLIIAPTISSIIRLLKSYVSKEIGFSIWQKSFHDHIIRNEQEYRDICDYIDQNPQKWQEDCYFTKSSDHS
ncbi:transposase [Acetanaerobacterium elongatum]|nr:transposase [Acetanaerobacterium elongatum]